MIVDFFVAAAGLKSVPRQGWIDRLGMKNPESVADHSYLTSLMSLVLSESLDLDAMKVVKMSLLHDLAESKTGDLTPARASGQEKKDAEDAAMDEILKDLPERIRRSYRDVWREFRDGVSEEARFVHEVDKLEMALQAAIYSGDTGIESVRPFIESAKSAVQNRHLRDLLGQITSK